MHPHCPVCSVDLEGIVSCPSCGTMQHEDCFRFNGSCAIYGCEGKAVSIDEETETKEECEQPVQKKGKSKDPIKEFEEVQARVKSYEIIVLTSPPEWHLVFSTLENKDRGWMKYPSNIKKFIERKWNHHPKDALTNARVFLYLSKDKYLAQNDYNEIMQRKSIVETTNPAIRICEEFFECPLPTQLFEQVVKDLLTVGRWDDALKIAEESEDLRLLRKTYFVYGSARIKNRPEQAMKIFLEGKLYESAVQAALQIEIDKRRSLFTMPMGGFLYHGRELDLHNIMEEFNQDHKIFIDRTHSEYNNPYNLLDHIKRARFSRYIAKSIKDAKGMIYRTMGMERLFPNTVEEYFENLSWGFYQGAQEILYATKQVRKGLELATEFQHKRFNDSWKERWEQVITEFEDVQNLCQEESPVEKR